MKPWTIHDQPSKSLDDIARDAWRHLTHREYRGDRLYLVCLCGEERWVPRGVYEDAIGWSCVKDHTDQEDSGAK